MLYSFIIKKCLGVVDGLVVKSIYYCWRGFYSSGVLYWFSCLLVYLVLRGFRVFKFCRYFYEYVYTYVFI